MEAAVPAAAGIPPVRTAYAGFWIRVLASLLDGLMVGGAGWVIERATGGESLAISCAAAIAIPWLYDALLESGPKQATLAKMFLGLIVTDEQGRRIDFARASIRHFAKYLSAILLMIGFIMVAFDPRKQGLHDKLAKTLVLKVGP
jgi:uncharacterized RDD family membrane protein YckC